MLILLGLILTLILGSLVLVLIRAKLNIFEHVFLGVTIGLGLVTQILFILDVINIRYSVASILTTLVVINVLLVSITYRKIISFIRNVNIPSVSKDMLNRRILNLNTGICLAIVFFIAGAFVKSLYWPVWFWDALALYDYRAKIFFEAQGIANSIDISSLAPHSYPPMTSLAHTFIYILGGINANPQFIYPLFYLSLIAIFYITLRNECSTRVSLVTTLFLTTIPAFVSFAANAYTNLPYAFYLGMGSVYLYRFTKEKDISLLIISGILMGLAGWTRSPTEQFFIANVFTVTLWCFVKRKFIYAPILLTLIYCLFAIPWRIYTVEVLQIDAVSSEVTNALQAGISNQIDIGRFLTVLYLLWGSIKNVSGYILVLAFISTALFTKASKRNFYLFAILMVNLGIFLGGSYLFSLSWVDWKDSIGNSADRLSMIFAPIALYYLAINTFSEKIREP